MYSPEKIVYSEIGHPYKREGDDAVYVKKQRIIEAFQPFIVERKRIDYQGD